MKIELTDNNTGKGAGNSFNRKDVSALFPIASKTVAELCRENENLLVFPYDIESSDDRIGDSSVLTIENTEDSEKVRISTGNIMGFIGVGNLQVKIQSRFDEGRDDYLLHYMLQRVLSFNLFDLNHNNEKEDVFDFIMFMFPYFLKAALRRGIYREYRHFDHNDAKVRGTIDVSRFIRQDMPFAGDIAYSIREHTHDNDMTQLIRHTIEFMAGKKYGQAVLSLDRETKDNVKLIVSHTPSYNKNERNAIIQRNLRPKVHPYYTEYKALQSLCIQILRMEEVKYGESEDEICGILFDGAWLWEEYVNTILKDLDFKHPKNKLGKGGIYLFEDIDESGKKHRSGIRYPDFYKPGFVLDAKYKRLGGYDKVSKVERDDLHQLITYMDNLKASRGGFVVPLEKEQKLIPTSHLKNSTSTLSIYGIDICRNAHSYDEFKTIMTENEIKFSTIIDKFSSSAE